MNILKEIDTKANELKAKILESKTEIEINGRCYYVANNGSDDNCGSIEHPWATLEKVTNVHFKAGDTVLFKRGDVFRGKITLQSGVTYSAYGEGEKPVICGSSESAAFEYKWSLVEGTENIWEYYTETVEIGSIFFNNGEVYAVKRCPQIINDEYEFGISELEDMQFITMPEPSKAKTLNNSNVSDIKGKLYLRCDKGNPAKVFKSIELAERYYLITVPYHSKNIIVDNLCVKYGGAHGIGGGFCSGLKVENCEIAFIGGAIMMYFKSADGNTYTPARYGNGVELHSYCNGYTVKNCYIHDIYDAGTTHQQGNNHSVGLLFKDVNYESNLFENCIYSIEYFAKKSLKNGATVLMENIRIADNIMRNAGYGFGSQRTLLDKDWNMGTHIMGWHRAENLTNGNFVIENNIFDRTLYSSPDRPIKHNTSIILTCAEYEQWLPTFSGNTYVCEAGNQFAYKGKMVTEGPIPFVKAEEGLSAEEVFDDKEGKIYII